MVGLTSRQDVADARKRDAPLMNTKAGVAGDMTGTIADLLPAAFIPGANTMAVGGRPARAGSRWPPPVPGRRSVIPRWEALLDIASLALGRGAGRSIGREIGVGTAFQGRSGAHCRSYALILRRRSGAAAQAVAGNLSNPGAVLPARITGDPLQTRPAMPDQLNSGTLRRITAEALQALTAPCNQANRGVMTGALGQIHTAPMQINAAAAAAGGAAGRPLYQAAGNATVPADADLGRILARPSVQSAWSRASQLAAERGETLTGQNANDISGNTLQYLKMALQDTANAGPQRGMGSHELGAVRSTLGDLQDWITTNVPGLRAADQAYAAGSAPINQMQIGRELSDRLQPALTDFGNNSRLNANSYANTQSVMAISWRRNVTGNSRATLAQDARGQSTTIRQIGETALARQANADDLGRRTVFRTPVRTSPARTCYVKCWGRSGSTKG